MAVTKDEVFSFIDNMTILDMSQFIKEFEERYGVIIDDRYALRLKSLNDFMNFVNERK